jgi:hypothetical protein
MLANRSGICIANSETGHRRPLPGDQEAHQEGDQGNPGRLTRRDQPPPPLTWSAAKFPRPPG